MSHAPQPRLRMKASIDAAPHALEFAAYLLGDGKHLLSPVAGACRIERIAGFKLVAHRLECGGICIKQQVPKENRQDRQIPAHGWGEVYGE